MFMVMALDQVREAVVGLVFVSLIAAASAIALTEFRNSPSVTANSYADNISIDGLSGIDNTTGFFGTIGTLVGVGALLAVVIGAFLLLQK